MSQQMQQDHRQPATTRRAAPWLPLLLGTVAVVVVAWTALSLLRPGASAGTVPSPTAARAAAPANTTGLFAVAPAQPASSGAKAPVNDPNSTPKVAVTAQGGIVSLPVADFTDSAAHFYTLQVGGKTIPFLVMKSADGVIRAAFDACEVCYQARKGYHQEGDELVCNNCGTHFPSTKINEVSGGCNPAPLTREVQGDQVIIKVGDIQAGARFF
jgi:hypothetical protein